jgi:peroxiredoxin
MIKTIRFLKESKTWQQKFDATAPKVGDVAPDFELRDVDGENPVRLSDFKGKLPVALVFGSFT